MLRVSSKGKHIEWDNHIVQQPLSPTPKSPESNMRKTRSVDFSRMTIRTSIGGHNYSSNHHHTISTSTTIAATAASQFSRRAARGSFKRYVTHGVVVAVAVATTRHDVFSRCSRPTVGPYPHPYTRGISNT